MGFSLGDKSPDVAVTHQPKFCATHLNLMTAVRIKWHVLSPGGISWHTNGARAGSRTLNLGIKSPLLCQLSYASVSTAALDSKEPRR